MAKPIKETPILRGKDAANFIAKNNGVKKESEQEKARIRENYLTLAKLSKF